MGFRIAPEGWPFIAAAWLIAALLARFAPWYAAALWAPIALWVIAFFRDPVRDGPRGEQLVIAPADGEVVSVVTVEEPDYVKGRAIRVSIFMNVFNVHVNRYPVSGTIEYRHYNAGVFGHAGTEKASLENEQCSLGIATAHGFCDQSHFSREFRRETGMTPRQYRGRFRARSGE